MDQILVFDSDYAGHRSLYVSALIDYWDQEGLGDDHGLTFVLPDRFLELNPEYDQPQRTMDSIRFLTFNKQETLQEFPVFTKYLKDWILLKPFLKRLNPAHCLCLYLDSLLIPFFFSLDFPPTSYSGIYFRPSFHYKHFGGMKPNVRLKIKGWLKKLLLKGAVNNEKLGLIFSLDKYAVEYINELSPYPKSVYLPEPSNATTKPDEAKSLILDLGIEYPRTVFLLFGIIKEKKGIFRILKALESLTPHQQNQLSLLILGPFRENIRPKLKQSISNLRDKTAIQIIAKDEYVHSSKVQKYFEVSDVILAPYIYHVGSSNIIIQASVAGKPVLGTDFGLLGKIIKEYRLGITVNVNDIRDISQGIKRFLEDPNGHHDPEFMKRFAAINSKRNFAKTVWEGVFNSIKDR